MLARLYLRSGGFASRSEQKTADPLYEASQPDHFVVVIICIGSLPFNSFVRKISNQSLVNTSFLPQCFSLGDFICLYKSIKVVLA
mgnify:CR=1 FL=1